MIPEILILRLLQAILWRMMFPKSITKEVDIQHQELLYAVDKYDDYRSGKIKR